MSEKISFRMQTPADEYGNRKDMHPITTTDEVIVDPESDNPIVLTEKIDEITGIKIQSNQPTFPCIWARPV